MDLRSIGTSQFRSLAMETIDCNSQHTPAAMQIFSFSKDKFNFEYKFWKLWKPE